MPFGFVMSGTLNIYLFAFRKRRRISIPSKSIRTLAHTELKNETDDEEKETESEMR